jgi:PAS domain S-box-containing protein
MRFFFDHFYGKLFNKVKINTMVFNAIIILVISINYFTGNDLIIIPGLIFFVAVNVNFLYYSFKGHYRSWATINLVLLAVILWFGFYHSQPGSTAIFWSVLFPVWAYGLLGYRTGNFYVLPFYAGLFIIYLTDFSTDSRFDFSPLAMLGYFAVLFVISFFVYINYRHREYGEDLLRSSSEKYETLLNHLPIGVIMINKKLEVLEANKQMKEWFPELKSFKAPVSYHSIHPESLGKFCVDCPVEKSLRDGRIHSTEQVKTTVVGERVFRIFSRPIKNKNGDVYAVLEILEDITEKKHSEELLKESEERLRALGQFTSAGIFLFRNNRFIMVNPAMERITGYSMTELNNMPEWEIIHADHRDIIGKTFVHEFPGEELLVDYEIKLITKSGEGRWVDFSAANVKINGKPTLIGTMFDITERKWAEETLEYEQHLMSLIMDYVPQHIYFKDLQSRFIRMNKALSKRFGFNHPAEATGKSDFDIFTSEHAQKAFLDEQAIIRTGRAILNIEEKETWPDGSVSWVSTSKMPYLDHKGNIIGTFGVSKDITELKYALEELKSSEEKYRLITENTLDVIWIYNLNSRKYTYISPSVRQLRGYTVEEAMNQDLRQSLTAESFGFVEKGLSIILNEYKKNPEAGKYQRINEIQQPCKDGNVIWVEVSIQLQTNSSGEIEILGVSRNIESRKKMEQEIQYKNQMQQLVSLISADFLAATDESINEKIKHTLQHAGEFFGMDRSYLFQYSQNDEHFSLTHEWCAEGIKPSYEINTLLSRQDIPWWDKTLGRNEPIYIADVDQMPEEAILEQKEFKSQDIQSLICFPIIINEQVMGFFGFDSVVKKAVFNSAQVSVMRLITNIISDALERNKAENALIISEKNSREAAQRYQAFIDASNTGAWEYNSQSDVLWCSPQYFRMLGRNIDDYISSGQHLTLQIWIDLLHPEDKESSLEYLRNYQTDPRATYQQVFRLSHSNGDYRWILSRGRTLEDENGNPSHVSVGTHIDITEQKKAEETIKAKNKELESYLYVASHDLRSPLVNIQGFSNRIEKHMIELQQTLEKKTLDTNEREKTHRILYETTPKSLSFIYSNVKKMDSLINGLLTISRTGRIKMNLEKIDMNALLIRIISTNGFQIEQTGADIKIENLPGCYGDANLLNQLFSNLIDNAIKYRNKDKQLIVRIDGEKKGNEVQYRIYDNGIGIAADKIQKIWDVFYRVDPFSSESGEGIGLNLASKIVEKHRGNIWAKSIFGEGTTFFVQLKCAPFEELN